MLGLARGRGRLGARRSALSCTGHNLHRAAPPSISTIQFMFDQENCLQNRVQTISLYRCTKATRSKISIALSLLNSQQRFLPLTPKVLCSSSSVFKALAAFQVFHTVCCMQHTSDPDVLEAFQFFQVPSLQIPQV